MPEPGDVPGGQDKILFTPGPLTTSRTVKQAMLRDLGSRDFAFIALVRDIRRRLLQVGGVADDGYTAVIMPGSGTFGLEAVIGSVLPPDGKLLVITNGAYGRRLTQIATRLGIATRAVVGPEDQPADPAAVAAALAADPAITHVAIIHCETTTGLINPVAAIGALVEAHGGSYIVDAMSSFGAVPLDLAACGVDYLISSANKCIEGVPGFAFILARRAALQGTAGWARSLSLDLYAQWQGLEADGQFRFTPPIQALLAFHQALLELEAEGGVVGRAARYQANYATLRAGMQALGFVAYLDPAYQGYIITTFRYPEDPRFHFPTFYEQLNQGGYVIYPGKLGDADCFRIGTIGHIFPADLIQLLAAIRATQLEMGITLWTSTTADPTPAR